MSLRVEPTTASVPLEAVPLAFARLVEPGVRLESGARLGDVVPDDIADAVARALTADAPPDGEPFDVVLRRASGRRTWSVRVSRSPDRSGGGVVAIDDITASRRIAFRARALQEVAVELGGVVDRDHVAASV